MTQTKKSAKRDSNQIEKISELNLKKKIIESNQIKNCESNQVENDDKKNAYTNDWDLRGVSDAAMGCLQ